MYYTEAGMMRCHLCACIIKGKEGMQHNRRVRTRGIFSLSGAPSQYAATGLKDGNLASWH